MIKRHTDTADNNPQADLLMYYRVILSLRTRHISFVQDEGWYTAAGCYANSVRRHDGLHILFLELGVGMNTPVIIKYPFWQMTAKNPKAVYACVNRGEVYCLQEIANQAVCINADIEAVHYAPTQSEL